jgi:hypothetical protein
MVAPAFSRTSAKNRFPGGCDWRTQAVQRAGDEAESHVAFGQLRDVCRRGVCKGRCSFLVLHRQRYPKLQAVQRFATITPVCGGTFGMNDAAPRRHPVHCAGPDRHRGAEAVAMDDFAVEQIGDGGKADMRMRPNVNAVAGLEHSRTEVVEKDERSDHARACRRQGAVHLKAAEVDRAGYHHLLNDVASARITGNRIFGREKAHARFLAAVCSVRVNRP